jgi:hypothetical protein
MTVIGPSNNNPVSQAETAIYNNTTLTPTQRAQELVDTITNPNNGLSPEDQVRQLANIIELETPTTTLGTTFQGQYGQPLINAIATYLHSDANLSPLSNRISEVITGDIMQAAVRINPMTETSDEQAGLNHLGSALTNWQNAQPPTPPNYDQRYNEDVAAQNYNAASDFYAGQAQDILSGQPNTFCTDNGLANSTDAQKASTLTEFIVDLRASGMTQAQIDTTMKDIAGVLQYINSPTLNQDLHNQLKAVLSDTTRPDAQSAAGQALLKEALAQFPPPPSP